MTDIADIVARAMGEPLIPGSTTISARLVISPELIDRMARAALTALQERGFVVVPVVPNLEMRKVCTFEEAEITWPAMLAASPGSGKEKD